MFGLMPWTRERKGSTGLAARPEMCTFRTAVDELFDRFFSRWPILEEGWLTGPAMNIEETDEAVVVRADTPGFEPAEFNIEVRGDVLKVVAEHKEAAKEEAPEVVRRLHREVTLPAAVDAEKVEAKYRRGVLEIRLPKAEPTRTRKIEVKAE